MALPFELVENIAKCADIKVYLKLVLITKQASTTLIRDELCKLKFSQVHKESWTTKSYFSCMYMFIFVFCFWFFLELISLTAMKQKAAQAKTGGLGINFRLYVDESLWYKVFDVPEKFLSLKKEDIIERFAALSAVRP